MSPLYRNLCPYHAAALLPLLKFGFGSSVYQIFDESEEILLSKRYFRKENPLSIAGTIQWIEMTGKEYYCFVTDPANRSRYFTDMGDVVLECTEAEYRLYKMQDDHSRYIAEQGENWITLSLNELEDQGRHNGEEIIASETENVCDLAILNIRKEALRKALQMLSKDDYRMVVLKYDPQYAMTEEKIGSLFGLSQSGVSKRIRVIKNFLKKFVIEFEKSSQ